MFWSPVAVCLCFQITVPLIYLPCLNDFSGMNAMIQNIERRIASWSQIPESHGEPIQVLRYKPGEEYRAHYDYFFHDAGKLNNRVATVLMYLSDVEVRVKDLHVPFSCLFSSCPCY